jgi:hypothetical protein
MLEIMDLLLCERKVLGDGSLDHAPEVGLHLVSYFRHRRYLREVLECESCHLVVSAATCCPQLRYKSLHYCMLLAVTWAAEDERASE